MKKSLLYSIILCLFTLTSCDDTNPTDDCLDGLNFTTYSVSFSEILGFDDFGSTGAALAIAIDNDKNAALIIGLKFTLPVYSKTFTPNCNPIETTQNYSWSQTNDITEAIALDYPYITQFLTNTQGLRTMDESISAFLVIKETDTSSRKLYVAIEGEIELTRYDDPSDLIEGSLSFIEITEASTNALIKENASYLKIDDIYLEWDTSNQP